MKYFQQNLLKLECIVMLAINIENLKRLKYYTFFKKALSFSIAYSKCGHEYEETFKEEELVEILKILGLINNIKEYLKIYNHV